ncbi:2'-5' RNA ligase family protein [Rhodococcus sp. IEGM 1379]|uniref:2'-5' RNA ligase family protein n=1 Tax=Rhodococcus sp. IEGM 1379 TaxID=3047086 RepID=UPI0024B7912E|nr:2'-5' RNA ligase family protein [Rhodococcus sp. IEGM 1379]MDI9915489.1 2'-5' RNA ligase family protein [Rhodococcus sp. IEGM 1379]
MVQSVELLLDASSESAIRSLWTALADAELPNQASRHSASNRPHITLFAAHSIPADVDEILVRRFTAPSFEVRLGGYIVFGGKQFVLARSVIPSRALLRLQRDVFEATTGSSGISAHIKPGSWTPHVTVARRITPEQLGYAVSLLGSAVIAGECGPIRRWDGDQKEEWLLTPPS